VFMKDERIRYNLAERTVVREHAVRCFCLSRKDPDANATGKPLSGWSVVTRERSARTWSAERAAKWPKICSVRCGWPRSGLGAPLTACIPMPDRGCSGWPAIRSGVTGGPRRPRNHSPIRLTDGIPGRRSTSGTTGLRRLTVLHRHPLGSEVSQDSATPLLDTMALLNRRFRVSRIRRQSPQLQRPSK
jgi:hypothetical protein